MRVLLLTHISFDEHSYMGGRWIGSLMATMKKSGEFEIGVAYVSSTRSERWDDDGVAFYPILHRRTIYDKVVDKIVARARMVDEPERMRAIVDDFKPDIIHLFGLETEIGSLLLNIHDVPVVVHIQGIISECVKYWFPRCMSPRWTRRNSTLSMRLKHITPYDEYRRTTLRSKYEIAASAQYRYYLGRTSWDRDFVTDHSDGGLYFHCDELLRDDFRNVSWHLPAGRIVIASTFNGEIYKGYDNIMGVATILSKKNVDFVWNVYGVDSEAPTVKLFEKRFGRSFTDVNVHFRGKAQAPALAGALAESTFYIHPSHIDNSPNSVCEAMMVGTPVIAMAVGGVPSLIDDGVNGFLAADYDVARVAYIIEKAADNRGQLESVSRSARETAMLRHDGQRVLESLCAAYRACIEDFKHSAEL